MTKPNVIYRAAIIGRPNVGKSMLFNRIIGRRYAITERIPGTTRDRVSAVVRKKGAAFEIVDTGGFNIGSKDSLSKLIRKQIEIAIEKTDIILFVCDIRDGVTPLDEEILKIIRKTGKYIILVVSKVDNDRLKQGVNEFFKFGLGDLYPVSAMHNIGVSALVDKLVKMARPTSQAFLVSEGVVKVAVVGRPNVGKSSLVNRIIDEERVIVHEEPCTTRDSIDIYLNRDRTNFIFIDTAGLRHKRKIKKAVDWYSLLRAGESVERSDICLVMIDAYEGLTRDDMRILKLVEESGKGCILIVNKWDLISDFEIAKYNDALIKKMHYIKYIPVLFVSCKSGLNLEEIFKLIKLVYRNMTARFSKEELGGILDLIKKTERIPLVRSGKLIMVYDILQKDVTPPTFNISVNRPSSVTEDYVEAIKNILREELGLSGVPMRITVK